MAAAGLRRAMRNAHPYSRRGLNVCHHNLGLDWPVTRRSNDRMLHTFTHILHSTSTVEPIAKVWYMRSQYLSGTSQNMHQVCSWHSCRVAGPTVSRRLYGLID